MARRPAIGTVRGIQPWEAAEAANTISRAREHLANPKMAKALKTHVDALAAAVSGPQRPKKP